MTWLRRIYILAVFVALFVELHAQDPVYSQFYNAPIQLNPGLVGLSEEGQVAINYRNQWTGWPQAYTTYSASFDQYFANLNSGLGVQLLSDNAGGGIIKTNKISGVYSYHLQLDKRWQARVGLEVGLIQTLLDWDQLIFLDQVVPGIVDGTPGGTVIPSQELPPESFSNQVLDIGMGGLFYSDELYFGIALKHLNSPNNSFITDPNSTGAGLPTRLSIHGGWQIDLDGYNSKGFGSFVAPSILYTAQSGLSQLNAGALYNKENVFGGVWLRHDLSNIDAAIVSLGLRTDRLKMSYSFDLTLSSAVITRTSGSHEVGVVMRLGPDLSKGSKVEDCFSIFR
ncbi:MAG: PorP/SprF family type IX secretion system membrane protein [Bacteroidota bacterium]